MRSVVIKYNGIAIVTYHCQNDGLLLFAQYGLYLTTILSNAVKVLQKANKTSTNFNCRFAEKGTVSFLNRKIPNSKSKEYIRIHYGDTSPEGKKHVRIEFKRGIPQKWIENGTFFSNNFNVTTP